MNTGVTTSKRCAASDEQYTPYYAVQPLLQYLEGYVTHTTTVGSVKRNAMELTTHTHNLSPKDLTIHDSEKERRKLTIYDGEEENKSNITIWCPFDEDWSAYVQTFRQAGYTVINTHLNSCEKTKQKINESTGNCGICDDSQLCMGHDFFQYQPSHYDIIISNPPFSKKDAVLKRLHELNKPYAILLPINSLQGKGRFKYMDNIQLLFFNERIGFHNEENMDIPIEGSPFASGYFCKGFLPHGLIGLELEKYTKSIDKGK